MYLDIIFVYIKDSEQANVDAICSILDIIQKHGLFANLKKFYFHKNKFYFLNYIVLTQSIHKKDKKIGLNQSEYKISGYFWALPNSISNSFKGLVRLLGYSHLY